MLDSYPSVLPGPPRPSQILTPEPLGVRSGLERFEVPGGGAWLIALGAGDRVSVINLEGGQRAELIAADDQGRIDPQILGVGGNSDASGLKALLADARAPGLAGLRLGIEKRGINLAHAQAVTCFGAASPAGSEETLTASRDGVLIIAAPAAAMQPDAQDTATPIGVRVQRSSLINLARVGQVQPLSDGAWRLTMASGAELVVSRTYRDAVLEKLGRTPQGR